jgi:hypothetical protein
MKRINRVGALVCFCFLFACSQSKATGLFLNSNTPDFNTSVTNVTYNSTTGSFLALGYLAAYNPVDYDNDTEQAIGPYSLSATITTGGLLTSGALTISGDVGSGYGTLLTASLIPGADGTTFGSTPYGSDGTLFEFLFNVTGGETDVVDAFGGSGGVIMNVYYDPGTPFVDWTQSFSSHDYTSEANNYAVIPEPSSILLVLFGCTFCSYFCRRKQRLTPWSTQQDPDAGLLA